MWSCRARWRTRTGRRIRGRPWKDPGPREEAVRGGAAPGLLARVAARVAGTHSDMKTPLVVPLALSALLLTACGEDAEVVETAPTFCSEFSSPAASASFGSEAEIAEAATFFRQLQRSAPEEISPQVATVADGLETVGEAFGDLDGAGGVDAIEGVQEAAGVDLDEVSRAAQEVREYAAANCEDVDAAE